MVLQIGIKAIGYGPINFLVKFKFRLDVVKQSFLFYEVLVSFHSELLLIFSNHPMNKLL